jgi:hypothetical protein
MDLDIFTVIFLVIYNISALSVKNLFSDGNNRLFVFLISIWMEFHIMWTPGIFYLSVIKTI